MDKMAWESEESIMTWKSKHSDQDGDMGTPAIDRKCRGEWEVQGRQ